MLFHQKNYTNILLHLMLGTAEQSTILADCNMRRMLFESVTAIGSMQGFQILDVGGCNDHLHVIVELGKNQKTARIVHTIQ